MRNDSKFDLERKENVIIHSAHARLFLILITMTSVNRLILVGHVAADPEQSQTAAGKVRVIFPVATHRSLTSDGVEKEVTDFHRVVAWGELGANCLAHLAKGQGVYIEGTLLNRAYEQGGERKYVTEIHADEVNSLTWRKKSGVDNISIDPLEVE